MCVLQVQSPATLTLEVSDSPGTCSSLHLSPGALLPGRAEHWEWPADAGCRRASERSVRQVLQGQRSWPTPGTAAGGHRPGHSWANGSNSERALEREQRIESHTPGSLKHFLPSQATPMPSLSLQGNANYTHPLWDKVETEEGGKVQGKRGCDSHQSYPSYPTSSCLCGNRQVLWLDPVRYPEPQLVMDKQHLSKAGQGSASRELCNAVSDWSPAGCWQVLKCHTRHALSFCPTLGLEPSSHRFSSSIQQSVPLGAHLAFPKEARSSPKRSPLSSTWLRSSVPEKKKR